MSTNSVSGVNSVAQNSTDTVAPTSSQTLSQADFLKLLVAQMTSQDPLNPTSSQDLLTQTVQLSTLQSNTSLQTTLTQLQSNQSLTQAGSLLGRQVTLQSGSSTTQGVVSGVDLSSGIPLIMVGGTAYDLSEVLSISTPTSTQ
jgi:flagellar basal-body rod modification protein FlgD